MGCTFQLSRSLRGARFIVVLPLALAIALAGLPFASAPAVATEACHLQLNDGAVVTSGGTVYRQDFYINASLCTFVAGSVRELAGPELLRFLNAQPGTSERAGVKTSAGSSSGGGKVAAPRVVINGSSVVYNRHSTWDCCGLETTYVDHEQSYTWNGSTSTVTSLWTTAWWRTASGWVKTGGPSTWYNTANPASSVSTQGSASFDNTSFPCGCQPCTHTLYSEVRSYASGSWTRSSSWSGYLCSGFIHTDSTWGTR